MFKTQRISKLNNLTMNDIDCMIYQLSDIFGKSGSKVELFNDLDKVCIYSVNTHYSIGNKTIKELRDIKAKIKFIDYDQNGLRLLIEVKNQ